MSNSLPFASMGSDRLKLYPGRKGRLGEGKRSDGCDFGWGKFFGSCCCRRVNRAPSVYAEKRMQGPLPAVPC